MPKIKELNIIISDGNYSSKYPKQEEFIKSGIPFIRANNMNDYTITDEDMYFISEEKHSELKKGHLKTGDVLIVTRGSIGMTAIVPEDYNDANINAQIVLLRTDEKTVHNRYLLWCLNSKYVKKQIKKFETGSTLKQLPVSKINEINIELPDYSVQKEIAKELDLIYKAIKNRRNSIEDLEKLIEAKIKEFSHTYGTERTKVSSLVEEIENIKKSEVDIEYIDISSINNTTNRIENTKKFNLSEAPSRAKQIVKYGDVLYSGVRPNLKNIAIVKYKRENLIASTGFIVLRPKNNISSEYLFRLIYSDEFTRKMVQKTVGASYPAINKKDLLNEYIDVLSVENRKKIADIIKKIEKQKDLLLNDIEDLEKMIEMKLISEF